MLRSLALTATLALATLAQPAPATDAASALETLTGTYADPAPRDWGRGTFGTREFTFADGRWTLRFTLALDPAMQAKVFEFRTQGSYDILGPSPAVPEAHEALFREEAKFLTLLTADAGLAAAFGLAACGLTPGIEADISATGCALWKPVSVCGEDHDLLAPAGADGLRFGQRPADNDMCSAEKRPTALTEPVMRR